MLDKTSQQVLEYINAYIEQFHFSPSQRDIARACHINAATVVRHLDLLEARGLIRREPGVARSIILCNPDET